MEGLGVSNEMAGLDCLHHAQLSDPASEFRVTTPMPMVADET